MIGPLEYGTLLDTPPKIGTEDTFTCTPSGSNISTPPNMADALFTTSSSIIAFLKSNFTPPNTAFTVDPEKTSFC